MNITEIKPDSSTGQTAKAKWLARVNDIADKRSWDALMDHFHKHLDEMRTLDSNQFPDRAVNKAFSLVDLCAFAITRMNVPGFVDFFDAFPHDKLLERIDVHEAYLQKIREEQEERRKEYAEAEAKRKASPPPSDDGDTD
jgi:hypothetical protein